MNVAFDEATVQALVQRMSAVREDLLELASRPHGCRLIDRTRWDGSEWGNMALRSMRTDGMLTEGPPGTYRITDLGRLVLERHLEVPTVPGPTGNLVGTVVTDGTGPHYFVFGIRQHYIRHN